MDLARVPLRLVALLAVVAVAAVAITVPIRSAAGGATAALRIDADPSGTPCSPVDTVRAVAPSASFSVALCLTDASAAPVNGGFTTTTLDVSYGGGFTATDNPGDAGTGLGGNPLWNTAAANGGAGAWDCNQLGQPQSAPSATPSPATITCSTNSVQDQTIGSPLLATLTLMAPGGGGTTLDFAGTTAMLAGAFEGLCADQTIECFGANITVTGGGDTPTPAPPTATFTPVASSTPCANGVCPTSTSLTRRTVTPTATPPGAETPGPGETPGAPPPPPAGPTTPGGGPGGAAGTPGTGITGPDTGSGGSGGGMDGGLFAAMLAAVAAGALAVGGGMYLRRRRVRGS
jgi:hypothetical protein